MVELGEGQPVVLIPGLQGRWEWMRPAATRLSERYRLLTFSLCDEPTSGFGCDEALGFGNYVRQVTEALDRTGLERAVLIGVSYGGLIAAEVAARHPERVAGLVLASALPTDWTPDRRARFYLRAPWLLSPLFVASSPLRLQPEVRAAFPRRTERLRFMIGHGARVLLAPTSPAKMARRIRWADAWRFAEPSRVSSPVLVVTGEPGLDRVVPVEVSRRIIERLPGARHVVLPHTGHLGIVTRPERFRDVLDEFVRADCRDTGPAATGLQRVPEGTTAGGAGGAVVHPARETHAH